MNDMTLFNEILSYLFSTFQEYSELDFFENHIDYHSPFADLALDSVDLIKIIINIEEKYEFEFTNDELALNNINCIYDMASFIAKRKYGIDYEK